MVIELSALTIGLTIGGLAYGYGAYRLGKHMYMREIHSLARDGILTIVYNKQRPPSLRDQHHDDDDDDDEEGLDVVSYERRDSGERRDNWAQHLMRKPKEPLEKK